MRQINISDIPLALLNNLRKTNRLDLVLRRLTKEHAIIIKPFTNIHSKERTLTIARNYNGIRFSKDYPYEYEHARKNKYLDELKIILSIVDSKERTLELVRNYKGTNFGNDYPNEERHARMNNYLYELNVELARNYKGNRFSKDYKKNMEHARRNHYINELKAILNKKMI